MVRAGKGATLIDDFRTNGLVAIGWSEIGQFAESIADDRLNALFDEHYPKKLEATRRGWAGIVKRFIRKISRQDQVITYDPEKRLYVLGTVQSDADWRKHECPRFRRVEWTDKVQLDQLTESTRNSLAKTRKALSRLNEDVSRELRQRAVSCAGSDHWGPSEAVR